MRYLLPVILAALTGCGFHVEHGNVPEKLETLGKKFDIHWPANYTNSYSGSVTDDRGNSDIVVRLEVTDSAFLLWQRTITNKLQELQFSASKDPKLEGNFPWWDCASFKPVQVSVFVNDLHDPHGQLYVWFIETNKMSRMYIHGVISDGDR